MEHLSVSHLLANQIAIVCDFMSLQDWSDRRAVFRDSRVLYHSLIVYVAIWIVSHCPPACLLYNTPFSQHFFTFSAFWTKGKIKPCLSSLLDLVWGKIKACQNNSS